MPYVTETRFVPQGCLDRKEATAKYTTETGRFMPYCVFNGGAFGFCMCDAHYTNVKDRIVSDNAQAP